MTMAYSETAHSPHRPAMDARVQRQLATYWRVRISKTIQRLEAEARRMLALETELSTFANDYYAAVGDATTRLAQLEAQTTAAASTQNTAVELEEMLAYREGKAARTREIKARYRSIAMEIHPDRAMLTRGAGNAAENMQSLNEAYQRGDLAGLLRLEAQLQLTKLCDIDFTATAAIESALHDVNRAADTYANSYRALLNSPLNELMLRAMSARMEGWDFVQAVVRNIEQAIEEKEQALLARVASAANDDTKTQDADIQAA